MLRPAGPPVQNELYVDLISESSRACAIFARVHHLPGLELRWLSVKRGEHRTPVLLAANPSGKVPFLVEYDKAVLPQPSPAAAGAATAAAAAAAAGPLRHSTTTQGQPAQAARVSPAAASRAGSAAPGGPAGSGGKPPSGAAAAATAAAAAQQYLMT
uniref:GST N-terminal domain-containing protein n=1 Tax=Dunaliella tertiolecta TaxID=3047 RepID=A0A7S3VQ36_DUNTE